MKYAQFISEKNQTPEDRIKTLKGLIDGLTADITNAPKSSTIAKKRMKDEKKKFEKELKDLQSNSTTA